MDVTLFANTVAVSFHLVYDDQNWVSEISVGYHSAFVLTKVNYCNFYITADSESEIHEGNPRSKGHLFSEQIAKQGHNPRVFCRVDPTQCLKRHHPFVLLSLEGSPRDLFWILSCYMFPSCIVMTWISISMQYYTVSKSDTIIIPSFQLR